MANTGLKPPWKPGQSGNPGGRPKGFARQIREATKDGAELVAYAVDRFANGSAKERWDALEWLTDRGFGKAASHAPVEDGDPLELGDVERRIADIMDELAPRRQAKATGPASPREVADASSNGTAPA